MSDFLKNLLVLVLHIGLAVVLVYLGMAYLVRWTGVPETIAVVALFLSFPVLAVGILYMSCGSYSDIPELAWICVGMAVAVGTVFIVGIVAF